MTKSEFYIAFYVNRGHELSTAGYPKLSFATYADPTANDPSWVPSAGSTVIETEEDWDKYLLTELAVEDFCRVSPEACEIAGVEFQEPYEKARIYPSVSEQLDSIYKALKTLKDAGTDLGEVGSIYVDAITLIKETHPKN